MDIEILDDVGQIRRMDLRHSVLGNRQSQQIRRGKRLNELPSDQLIFHLVVEEGPEEETGHFHQADSPQ